MVTDDPLLELQAKFAALEYVQKITLQVLHQLAPNSGAHTAMIEMLNKSIVHAHVTSNDPAVAQQMKDYVVKYATQIIDAGFQAKPAPK